jgi:hypothetical protein
VIGRKNKELRLLARRAVANLTMVKAVSDATSPTTPTTPDTTTGGMTTGGIPPTGMTPTSAMRMNAAAYRGDPDLWAPPMEGVDPL